jgi:hypothetical protein
MSAPQLKCVVDFVLQEIADRPEPAEQFDGAGRLDCPISSVSNPELIEDRCDGLLCPCVVATNDHSRFDPCELRVHHVRLVHLIKRLEKTSETLAGGAPSPTRPTREICVNTVYGQFHQRVGWW